MKKKLALAVLVLLAAIQLVPVERSNPPVEGAIDAPAEVLSILRRACFDCHSHETRWPWYAYVAPASWLVAHDVEEAREHLNLSTWGRLTVVERAGLVHEMWEEVEDGEMPLWYYQIAHPASWLSEADHAVLRDWAMGPAGGG